MKQKIIVIGSFFQDLAFYCQEFPKPGQTLKCDSFITGLGGKGSNQAIAAQKLSNSVHFISAVGNDVFGQGAAAYYSSINLSHFLQISSKPTGCAGIYVNSHGENEILINEGAMGDLCLEKIKQNLDEFLPAAELIIFQAEMNFENLRGIMRYCRENSRGKIIFNPAPWRSDYKYEEIFPLIDLIIPNETEFRAIFSEKMPPCIKTLGEKGCQLGEKIIPGFKVTAVDTTGAGDCWIGAFAAKYIETKDYEKSCIYANKAASIQVTRKGTAMAMPEKDEV